MTMSLDIPQGESGRLRLFHLEMGAEELRFLSEEGAIRNVLGVGDLDESRVQVIKIKELDDLGLIGFLREGCDISEDQLGHHEAELEALTGAVMLVPSSAFSDAVQIQPDPRLRPVLTVREKGPDWSSPGPIKAKSAEPYSAGKLPPREARKRAITLGASFFVVVMTLIVALIWWLVT